MLAPIDQFVEQSAPYFEQYPFMQHSDRGNLDGNAILYAGSWALLKAILFGKYDKANYHSEGIYFESKVGWGIISRGPHKHLDSQRHDDYVGLATMSFLGSKWVATQFYHRGPVFRRPGFNSFKERFNSHFWRIPGVWQHIKLCAGKPLNWFDRFWLALGIYANQGRDKNDTSGRILKWHMRRVYQMSGRRYWLVDKAIKYAEDKQSEMYPHLMGDVFGIYFKKDHILAKWSVGIK